MLFALGDALDRLGPRIPPALAGEERLSWVRAVASSLPDVGGGACLECRLNDGADQVDLLVGVVAGEGGREALLSAPPGAPIRRSPGWRPALDLAETWARPGSLLHAQVPFLILELDVTGPPASVPSPVVLLCIQPDRAPAAPAAPSDVSLAVTLEAIALLLGHPLEVEAARALAACFAALAPEGHVRHVAPLHPRGLDAIRLVCSLPRDRVPRYLERIGWPGQVSVVEEVLAAVSGHASHVDLQIDVGAAVLDTVSVESVHPGADPRHASTLDWLAARGACSCPKRAAALEWPGRERVALPGYRWPSLGYRDLHVKVVCRRGLPLAGKAYLELGYRFSLFAGGQA